MRQALYTSLSGPYASVVDSAGDLFIADSGDNVIDEVNQSTGAVTIVAGDGTQNYSGDGGPATAAELSSPDGLALDGSGDLFIADTDNNAIREVNLQTGIINTVAGNGTSGYSGDSGQATAATLNFPNSIALDTSGDLFIADTGNNVVREVNLKTGIITTVAGNGTAGYSGDSGQATAAELNGPGAVAADSSGDLFIADTGNNLIREVKLSSGIITTVAGSYNDGNGGYSGDGGQATAAELNFPDGVAYSSGDLFIADADNNVIREVHLGTGIITTVAGNGNAGYSGDGDQATAAELNSPGGVALDSSGDLFIADTYNNVIREVNSSNKTIATVAGGDAMGYSGDGGPASDAGLNFPDGIASDASGDLFITDDGNNVVREINATTGVITTIAGNGTYGYSGDTGQATAAELASPDGVVWSSSGDLFIADSGNDVVREVNLTTGIITTIAGNGTGGYSGDGDQATAAELNAPGGLALDSSGDLFIADSGNNVVREVNLNTGIITTVAGNGTADYSGDGDQATAAELNSPEGVALDNSGDLFIADSSNNAIREVNLETGIITTIAGDGTADYSGDNGQATAAELNFPNGVAVNTSGDLFVADGDNNVIREVDLKTGIITTVAGNSTAGYSGDGGLATAAELNGPGAIALDSSGDLFVADSGNNVIRELPAPTNGAQTVDVTPASLTVKANNATMVYGRRASRSERHDHGLRERRWQRRGQRHAGRLDHGDPRQRHGDGQQRGVVPDHRHRRDSQCRQLHLQFRPRQPDCHPSPLDGHGDQSHQCLRLPAPRAGLHHHRFRQRGYSRRGQRRAGHLHDGNLVQQRGEVSDHHHRRNPRRDQLQLQVRQRHPDPGSCPLDGDGQPQYQALRRHDLRRGRADHHLGQPGPG